MTGVGPRPQLSKADARLRRGGRTSVLDRIELWLSTARYIDGLWVGTIEGEAEPILRRVEAALATSRRKIDGADRCGRVARSAKNCRVERILCGA